MKALLLERVPFRLPGKARRLIWAVVIAQREGLSLLYVKRPDENWSDSLVVAVQKPKERYFEAADRFSFPLEGGDLSDIGGKLQAMGDDESEASLKKLLEPEDLF